MTDTIVIPVTGGMCVLEFWPGFSCGRDPDTQPGVNFTFVSETSRLVEHNGKFYGGMGVFSRSDAKRLADALNAFLATNPPVSP